MERNVVGDRSAAIIKHAVVIAGGGPTGLMLAGELALAGIDVAIVERRVTPELTGARAGGLQSRTIEVLDQRGIAERFLSQGQLAQVHGFAMNRLDISDFPTRHNYGLALWQTHIERILREWVAELAVPIYRGREVTGFEQDDTGVDVQWFPVGNSAASSPVGDFAASSPVGNSAASSPVGDFAASSPVGDSAASSPVGDSAASSPVGDSAASPGGQSLRAEYLVGCDGGRSLIRKAAGIEFPGWDPTTSALIAEVVLTGEPQMGIRRDAKGTHAFGRLEYEIRNGEVVFMDHGPVRVMVTEQHPRVTGKPTLRDLSEALIAVWGTDYGVHHPTFLSRFTDMTRQAAAYRKGRVLLAGDAAHVHSPVGGQGLNTGVQDAVNLGWKLAQVIKGISPDNLLDTYHAERHPVGARVLRNTMAQVALLRPDDRTKALDGVVSELLSMDEPRKRYAAMMSGLDIHYDTGQSDLGRSDLDKKHPLLGRRMPDLDLVTADGPLRVFTLLHKARPVLLNLGQRGGIDVTPWADRVQSIDAEYAGAWELPALGAVTAPTAVLIRPDGYVAWVGDQTQLGLAEALTTWFGPPAAA